MRVFGIISLLAAIVIIAFLFIKQLDFIGGGSADLTAAVDQAKSIQNQSSFNAVSTQLNVYYTENKSYPRSLEEIGLRGYDPSKTDYQYCNSNKVIVTIGSEYMVFEDGATVNGESSC